MFRQTGVDGRIVAETDAAALRSVQTGPATLPVRVDGEYLQGRVAAGCGPSRARNKHADCRSGSRRLSDRTTLGRRRRVRRD